MKVSTALLTILAGLGMVNAAMDEKLQQRGDCPATINAALLNAALDGAIRALKLGFKVGGVSSDCIEDAINDGVTAFKAKLGC